MANDLAAMVSRIAAEIARPDLAGAIGSSGNGPAIRNAINDAIYICQKFRFRFNEAIPPTGVTFNTVIGQSLYAPAGILSIDYLGTVAGDGSFLNIARSQPELVKLLASQSGTPDSFAMEGEKIILAPVPSTIITINVFGHILLAAPASDGEVGNRWMTDGERMVRFLAKREVARNVTRNKEMDAAMDAAWMSERDNLISEAGRLLLFQQQQMRQLNVPPEPR